VEMSKITQYREYALAALAAVLCIAFLFVATSAMAAGCNPYGIHVGADGNEANKHFIKNTDGWNVSSIEYDEDDWKSSMYTRSFRDNVQASVTIMENEEGLVVGIYTIALTHKNNEAGLKEMAKTMATRVMAESTSCGAEVYQFDIGTTKAYYAERADGTAMVYYIAFEGDNVAVIFTYGPAVVIGNLVRNLQE
jgi:hypothetical protein